MAYADKGIIMFTIKESSIKTYNGNYMVDPYSVVYNSVCAGGQLFFGDDRHFFIDIDIETGRCYGISIILDAFDFCNIDYTIDKFSEAELFYNDPSTKKYQFYTTENLLPKCYVNKDNRLILIGNPNTKIELVRFFDDTYAAINDNRIELLIIRVGEDVIQKIKSIKE